MTTCQGHYAFLLRESVSLGTSKRRSRLEFTLLVHLLLFGGRRMPRGCWVTGALLARRACNVVPCRSRSIVLDGRLQSLVLVLLQALGLFLCLTLTVDLSLGENVGAGTA